MMLLFMCKPGVAHRQSHLGRHCLSKYPFRGFPNTKGETINSLYLMKEERTTRRLVITGHRGFPWCSYILRILSGYTCGSQTQAARAYHKQNLE